MYHTNLLKKYIARTANKDSPEISSLSVINEDTNDGALFELNDFKINENAIDVKIGQNLTIKQQENTSNLAKEFEHRFTPDPGSTDVIQQEVKLTSEQPIYSKPYRLPYHTYQELHNDIKVMLDMSIIRESKYAYASPVVIVKKPDGSNRMCVDCRKLNKLTVSDPEPMPTAEELLQRLSKVKFLSKIDLGKGYWQVSMAEKDIQKAAFVAPDGHYEFTKMPFGMVSSGATLKRGLQKVLYNIENVAFYFDDILVHTGTWEEHTKTLRELF